jgi:hypothetical protein
MAEQPLEADLVGHRYWEGATKEHVATQAEIRYFGIVKRIPVAAFPRTRAALRHMRLEWDESAASVRRDLPDSLPVSMQGWEPMPNGVVERYEAFDRETGDLLVFWRVPCRRKG